MNKWVNAVKYISLVTQFGITVIAPVVLLLFAADWLVTRYSLGDWVFAVALAVGLLSSISGGYKMLRYIYNESRKDADKNRKQ